jgi:acyl carrier protein
MEAKIMEKKTKLFQIIAKIIEINVNSLESEMEINDIEGWDSMAHLQIIGEIEELFNVTIPIEEYFDMKTINDILAYLN